MSDDTLGKSVRRDDAKRPERRQRVAAKSKSAGRPVATEPARNLTLQVSCAGEWIEAETLHKWAIEQITGFADSIAGPSSDKDHVRCDLTLDLADVDHLDASALQIMLAIRAEQHRRHQLLHLVNASAPLQRWFVFAGATDLLNEQSVAKAV